MTYGWSTTKTKTNACLWIPLQTVQTLAVSSTKILYLFLCTHRPPPPPFIANFSALGSHIEDPGGRVVKVLCWFHSRWSHWNFSLT